MSNRVVDIVERCLRETFCMTSGCEFAALAILAALEKEGAKVMWREPTKEMAAAGESAVDDAIDEGQDSYQSYVIEEPDKWAAVGFQAMFDAAPRYGEPTGFQEDTRHYTEDERRSLGRRLADRLKGEPSG